MMRERLRFAPLNTLMNRLPYFLDAVGLVLSLCGITLAVVFGRLILAIIFAGVALALWRRMLKRKPSARIDSPAKP